jgi:hypothetical protein
VDGCATVVEFIEKTGGNNLCWHSVGTGNEAVAVSLATCTYKVVASCIFPISSTVSCILRSVDFPTLTFTLPMLTHTDTSTVLMLLRPGMDNRTMPRMVQSMLRFNPEGNNCTCFPPPTLLNAALEIQAMEGEPTSTMKVLYTELDVSHDGCCSHASIVK